MDLKFYLNKFAKIDNIEGYTLKNVMKMKDAYDRFLETAEGKDPDFPMFDIGGKNGKGKTMSKGTNVYSMFDEGEVPEDFHGIETRLKNSNYIGDKDSELKKIESDPRELRHRNTRNRKKQ